MERLRYSVLRLARQRVEDIAGGEDEKVSSYDSFKVHVHFLGPGVADDGLIGVDITCLDGTGISSSKLTAKGR